MDRERLLAIAQTLGALLLIALVTVLTKLALRDVSPFTFSWLPVPIGAAVLVAYTFGWRQERPPADLDRTAWLYIVLIGVLNLAVASLAFTFALRYLPAATQNYLLNMTAVATMLLSVFILRETPNWVQVIGLGVVLVGLRIYFSGEIDLDQQVGIAYSAVGVVALGLTNNLTRKLFQHAGSRLSNNMVSTLAVVVGALVLTPIGLVLDWPPQISGAVNWGILLFRAVVGLGLSFTVWNLVLRTLRSYEVSVLGSTSIIWTALLAIPILGELPSVSQVVGIGVMIAGLLLVQVRRAPRATTVPVRE